MKFTAATTAASLFALASSAVAAPMDKRANEGGFATYFTQNGNAGACGTVNSDDTPLVAIPSGWYGGDGSQPSDRCGQNVQITRVSDGRQVTAKVQDLCPSCDGDNSLDLSEGAFNQIASPDEGMVEISWSWA